MRTDLSASAPPRDTAAVLVEVASQLGATHAVDRLAATVVERMVGLLGAERALFVIYGRGGEIEHAVTHNLGDWPGPPAPLPVSQSIIQDAVRTGQLVVDSDEEQRPGSWRSSARVLHLRFLFAMPVHVAGRVAGVLYLDSRQAALRQVDDMEGTLVALARLVGTAMENAQLAEEAEFKNLLLALTVHDMRHPLTAARLDVNELLKPELGPGEVAEVAVDLMASIDRMDRLARHTLNLAQSDDPFAPHAEPSRMEVRRLLEGQVEGTTYMLRSQGVQVQIEVPPDLPPVLCWPDRVESVLHNLLANALAHTPKGSTITISAAVRSDAGPHPLAPRASAYLFRRVPNLVPSAGAPFVEVRVANPGQGIAPEVLPRLFEPWSRGKLNEERGRSSASRGLGLAICQQCVRSMGGRIWAASVPGSGATFTFTLPTLADAV